MSEHLKIHSIGMLTPPGESVADECPSIFLIGDADAIRSAAQFMGDSVSILPADELVALRALKRGQDRSFPEAGDGRPADQMQAELWAAGCDFETSRFVATQLRAAGLVLAPVEPNEAMRGAFGARFTPDEFARLYRAMLAAAQES